MKYKYLAHTADIKFQAFGKSLEETFENSAAAMKEIITKDKVKDKIKRKISVEGKDLPSLMYNFLEEFLFLLDAESFLLSKVKVKKISENKAAGKNGFILAAEATGDQAVNYECELDVKAVTYNDMLVKKEKGKFVAQVVLDV